MVFCFAKTETNTNLLVPSAIQFLLPVLCGVTPALADAVSLAPVNDNFDNRTDLGSGETLTVRQEIFRSTTEYGDPVRNSVWWQWTPPRDGWWEVAPLGPRLIEGQERPWAPMQVFTGGSLEQLHSAPDGGMALPVSSQRVLFRAKAGEPVQIAAAPTESNGYGLWQDAGFTLRPVIPSTNLTPEQALTLAPLTAGIWQAGGWANHVLDEIPDDSPTPLSAPLYWRWTAPSSGVATVVVRGSRTFSYIVPVIYRSGSVITQSTVGGTPVSFTAQAGTEYIVASASFYRSTAVDYHTCEISHNLVASPGTQNPNYNSPFPLPGVLPVSGNPGTFRSSEILWRWTCPINGWVEFDGPELTPRWTTQDGVHLLSPGPPLSRNGKSYQWLTARSWLLSVYGRNWPQPETPAFTLRAAILPPPCNDLITAAADLGTAETLTEEAVFYGATRSPGDPPGAQYEIPAPTLWYRFTAPPGTRAAQVFSDAKPVLYRGSDPAFLTELGASPLSPTRSLNEPESRVFAVTGSTPCFLGLSGTMENSSLRIRFVKAAFPFSVIPLTPGPVAEGYASELAPDQSEAPGWFSWQAPADGRIRWESPSDSLSAYRVGLSGELVLAGGTLTSHVSAGEKWWFLASNLQSPTIFFPRQNISTVRVLFQPGVQPPGDDPAFPQDLGDALPVRGRGDLGNCQRSTGEDMLPPSSGAAPVQWFRWTAPQGVDLVRLVSDGLVYCLAGAPDGPLLATSSFSTPAVLRCTPGHPYFFALTGDALNLELTPVLIERPANDTFADAPRFTESPRRGEYGSAVPAENALQLRMTSLTAEPGEPLADPALPAATRSAWWEWRAPVSGVYSLAAPSETASSGTIHNSYIRPFTVAVYQGDNVAALTRVPGTRTVSRKRQNGQRLTFRAEAGQLYRLQAASQEEFGGIGISIAPGDAYDQWALSFASLPLTDAGPEANPSGDGLPNLLKFALGLDPTLPLSSDPSRDHAPDITPDPVGGGLILHFWSDKFRTHIDWPGPCGSVRIIAQQSTGLSTWTDAPEATPAEENRWQIQLPRIQAATRFLRLKAEWCPEAQPQ